MAELADNGLNRKIQDAGAVGKEIDGIEASIAELRNSYEQYFLGIERRPPNTEHAELKRRLQRLKGAFVRQTALKFRVNTLQSKFVTYERLWARTIQEIEDGTYRRDLYKVKKRLGKAEQPKAEKKPEEKKPEEKRAGGIADALDAIDVDAVFDELEAPPAPKPPPTPVPKAKPATGASPVAQRPVTGASPAAPRPAAAPARPPSNPAVATRPVGAGGDQALSDAKLRQVYDAYLSAKKKCQEDVSALSYDSVAANLRKQVPELMRKSGAKGVEFKVVIKDGKAVLRAVPK